VPRTTFYDMHVHLHEFSDEELETLASEDITLVAVSEDLETLQRTVEIAGIYDNVIPCAGYHPWNFRENGRLSEAVEIARRAYHLDMNCIGEIGLDKKFVPPETWNAQVEVARLFLRLASELNAYVTLHSPNAWRSLLSILIDVGVEKAMFHWYSGPLDLAYVIINSGYYVSINPALKVQSKHRMIAEKVPLEGIVLESDGPYNYRGLKLHPLMIKETVDIIAKLRGVPREEIINTVRANSERLLFA
jgi:TatD DNase family protein